MSEPGKAVFLSYASQDAEAAKRMAEALRAAGVEVWFDQNELVGGDAWDAKIRGQISSCALFVPVISANTQARLEGYFRREWKQAAARTHDMADEKTFLLPVVIDATRDAEAKVPAEFKAVQWTRLPGGETPAAFVTRVARLLEGGVAGVPAAPAGAAGPAGMGDYVRETTAAATDSYGTLTARSKAAWNRLSPLARAVLSVVFALVGLGIGLLLGRDARKPSPPAPAVVGAIQNSEAQKLVAQARRIYEEGDEINRENLMFAEDLVKRALALDPADPAAWELAARLSHALVWFSIDASESRREMLMQQANRARALAPESVSAQLVTIDARLALNFGRVAVSPGFEQEVRDLVVREPGNWSAQRSWSTLLRFLPGREEESLAAIRRAVELSNGNPAAIADLINTLVRQRKFAEADAVMARYLPDHPTARLLCWNVILHLRWRGGPAAAQQSLARFPTWLLQEDRGLFLAWQTWFWSRDAAKALRAAQAAQRDYVRDFSYYGPRAALTARAHELAGNTEAARADWQAALARTERELAEDAQAEDALYWKAWALSRLGRVAEARPITAQLRQRNQGGLSAFLKGTSLGALLVTTGEFDEALAEISTRLTSLDDSIGVTRPSLELDPAYDPLRNDPRFITLLRQAPAPDKSGPGSGEPATARAADLSAVGLAKADEKSVAVLPFANLSGDKEQEYFSDGLTEEILNTLARERDLRVSGRASSFSFKGRNVSSVEIAKTLNVSRLVEGSVRKAGNKVRISVSLTRAADGFSEELGTFTEELSDVFALQDKVARAVVEKLTRRTVTSASVGLTRNPEAYDAYLRGRSVQTRTPRLMGEAIQHYERAVALDAGFALAWARLAEARFRTFVAQADRSPAVVNGSREAIDRALATQPDLPEALIMRANWTRRVQSDFAAARRDLERVESLHPVTADLRHAQAQLAQELGQFADAFRLAREALQLDPQNGDHLNAIGISLCLPRGEFVEADQLIRRAIVVQGTSSATPFVNLVHLRNLWRGPEAALRFTERWPADQGGRGAARVNLLVRLGRLDEARQEFDRLEGQTGPILQDWSLWFRSDQVEPHILMLLGREEQARQRAREIVAACTEQFARGNRSPLVLTDFIRSEIILGHRESALKVLEEWRTEAQRETSTQRRHQEFTSTASRLYALLGKVDEAVELLQELQANGHIGRYGLGDNPEYANLRGDPRFQEIVRQYEAWRKTLPDPMDL